MAKRLTPIERAIAGEPVDRQQRWLAKKRKAGFIRLTVMIPEGRARELHDLARAWRGEHSRGDD